MRDLAPSCFLPALIFEMGIGAMAPVLALTALHLGASARSAGFTLALMGIGQILGDLPAASLAHRVGDRRAMLCAAALAVAAQFFCLKAPSTVFFDIALLVIGVSTSTFYLARQTYLADVVPTQLRARAASTLGGSHRTGLFLGPFAGALAIHWMGLHGAYVVAMSTSSLTALVLIVVPDVPGARSTGRRGDRPARRSPATTIREHRRMFATLGLAVLAVGAVRASRQTVIPLWAEHIGLSAEQTSLIFGIASAVEIAVFYPSGYVMDRFGRLAIVVPAMTVLGTAMMLLPLSRNAVALSALAMLMSAGNGLGSGIMITIGADVAAPESRLTFLSLWRTLSDTGNALGPVVVSAVASVWALPLGIIAVGAAGPLAALGMIRWLPRYSSFATMKMMRQLRDSAA